MTISVVIADDQELIRAGLVMLLSAHAGIEVVAEAANGEQAIQQARAHNADVVVMDIGMPGLDGIAATRILSADPPDSDGNRLTKVLVLTTFSDDTKVYEALRAGANGFVLKHAAPRDLIDAVRRIAAGESWIDPAVGSGVIRELARLRPHSAEAVTFFGNLTPREREVLQMMAQGLSNNEIRDRLVLSEATVKTHVGRIIMKTGSRDRAQVVALAWQKGLVTHSTEN